MSLRKGDSVLAKEADDFIALHKAEWINRISSAALASFKERKYNNPPLLPVTSDLVKLKEHQVLTIGALTTELQNKPSSAVWPKAPNLVHA